MEALNPGPAGFPGREFENAIDLLSYQANDISADLASSDPAIAAAAEKKLDARIAHRDGLLFQHISWVAAALQFPAATACPPHVRKADKGFDGLFLEVDPQMGGLSRVVLCEDKASTSPRSLVTGKIWPEIRQIIAGDRDIEILDAVTALLDTMHHVDLEAVLIATSWNRARQFRVALTAGQDQLRAGGYQHLFGGYENHVAGALHTRMAEVMPMNEVRAYLDELAGRIVAKLQVMAAHV
jgi:hypothetical protein